MATRSKKPTEASPLVDAAQAFDETLAQFGALAESVGRAALDSAEPVTKTVKAGAAIRTRLL